MKCSCQILRAGSNALAIIHFFLEKKLSPNGGGGGGGGGGEEEEEESNLINLKRSI